MKRRIASSLFSTSGRDFTDQPAMAGQLRAAGFTHAETGFFASNPANSAEFSGFKAGFDSYFPTLLYPIRDAGLRVIATGDDLCRGTQALATALGGYGPQAVRYAVGALVGTGLCDGIEMCDEANIFWPVPNTDLERLVAIMREVQGCPPLGWPLSLHSTTQPAAVSPWCRLSLCDYASGYSPAQVWFSADLSGQRYSVPLVRRALESGLALFPGPVRSTLIPFCGDYGNGAEVRVGAWTPGAVRVSIWIALARGCEVLRFYSWDTPAWAEGRVNPTGDWSTGTTPDVGADRWRAASTSLRLIGRIEDQLLCPPVPFASPASLWPPATWVCAQRAGPAGGAAWAVNATERPATIPGTVPALPHAVILGDVDEVQRAGKSVAGRQVPGGGVVVWWGP